MKIAELERHHQERSGGWRSKIIDSDPVISAQEAQRRRDQWMERLLKCGNDLKYAGLCGTMVAKYQAMIDRELFGGAG